MDFWTLGTGLPAESEQDDFLFHPPFLLDHQGKRTETSLLVIVLIQSQRGSSERRGGDEIRGEHDGEGGAKDKHAVLGDVSSSWCFKCRRRL